MDLKETGMREREVEMILKLNEEAKIVIKTPLGQTKEIDQSRIVKQGTIYGPQLCCSSTARVNELKKKTVAVISPTNAVETLIYVDDINATGSIQMIERAGENLRQMEIEKKFTFNLDKTNYMIVRGNRKKKVEKPEINLGKGKVTEVNEYKYLGNWMTTTGTVERQITEVEGRMKGMVQEAIKITSEERLGGFSTEARLLLYEKTMIPVITYNLEVWTKLGKKEIERIERIQAMALKQLLSLPQSTPYWALLGEIGMWPLQDRVNYHRMMLLQNMITSDDDRLGKVIMEDQRKNEKEGSCYMETKEICERYGMQIDNVERMNKMQWKKSTKMKIIDNIERKWEERKSEMKKMRHQKGKKFEKKPYLKETTINEASEMIRSRLELWDIGNNQGKRRKCICGEEETSEHIVDCRRVVEKMKTKVERKWIEEEEHKWKVQEYTKWLKLYLEKREIMD